MDDRLKIDRAPGPQALRLKPAIPTEFELVASLLKDAPREATDLRFGAGDDCAVIAGPGGRDWLISTDALVEQVHFRREWTDFATLGRKALNVNMSDIAAMGGLPRFYLVAIGLPPFEAGEVAAQIYAGMRESAREHGALLIGGDTVASPGGTTISVTALGEIEHGEPLLRCGAKAGDAIFVTGEFGGAGLGLALLEAGRRGGSADRFILRHNDPSARVSEGRFVGRSGMATAMIDASDGLVADLKHLADASNIGFEIDATKVPRAEGFDALARELKLDPSEAALTGGEDYELIFTVAESRAVEFEKLSAGRGMVRIGTMLSDAGVRRVIGDGDAELHFDAGGFDHFRRGGAD